tara:strand:+ start:428 stop:1138 length:711 start_codon:yes stop_codon:yes gene_type:complete
MSNISELIEVIKKREGLRFDSEVATYMGIDRKSLAVAKSRKVIPISYINWYCKHYDIQRQKFEGHLKGSGTETESEESVEYTIIAQRETIELQKEKIIQLEKELKRKDDNKKIINSKPAYHFKTVSTYKAETDSWLDTKIFGDFSMTGYSYDEIVPILNEENGSDAWINRYHPDSKKRLCSQTLKGIKTDYHYLKWDHMMWMAKDGQYKCYNIDLLYKRAEEKVTCMYYWVNGDKE